MISWTNATTTTTNGTTETFYMGLLKAPVTESNYTETEKADKAAGKINGVYVNSEYSRIEEIVAIPYLANSKTDLCSKHWKTNLLMKFKKMQKMVKTYMFTIMTLCVCMNQEIMNSLT